MVNFFKIDHNLNSVIMIKLTFFSARTSPNFSHFHRQVKRALPFDFVLERDPKYCQRDVENYTDQVLDFLLDDRHEYKLMEFFGL